MRGAWRALAGVAVLLGAAAAQAKREGEPVRIAVVVGNNAGNDVARSLKYAEQEVARLAGLLGRSGDFQVQLLRGPGRGDVERALIAARTRLGAARASGRPTLFLFYYSGHGDTEALELGATRLPLRDLRRYLESLTEADVRLAFVDACQSGALTGVKATAKGGRRAAPYEVRLADPGQVKGMAIVTSSTANELSQESDVLKGSFFSHNVMSGLIGAADLSRDGQVTLSELYQYTYRRTLADTAASPVGGQHATWNYNMAGAGDVVLTRTRISDAQLRFPREVGVTYTVLAREHRDEVIAEVASSPGEELYLALPAGQYRLVRRALGSVRERQLALVAGTAQTVDPGVMTPLLIAENTHRKKEASATVAARAPGLAGRRNVVGAHLGMDSAVLAGAVASRSIGLSFLRAVGPWLALRARGDLGSSTAEHFGYRSELLRLALSVDALVPLVRADRFALLMGPTLGAPTLRQRDLRGETRESFGFSYGGVATAAARIAGATWVTLTGTATGELQRLGESRAHRAAAGLSGGAAFGF